MAESSPESVFWRPPPGNGGCHRRRLGELLALWCETGSMPKQSTTSLRQHLANLLQMKGAHLTFQSAVADFPAHLRGVKPPGAPHSAWQLFEHMRLAQHATLRTKRRNFRTTTGRPGKHPQAKSPGTPACGSFKAIWKRCRHSLPTRNTTC